MQQTAEEFLNHMKIRLELYAEELNGEYENDFMYGEKTAYVECLEMIQTWEGAKRIGLNYDIEKRFPL